tara:strand:- start:405 stop:1430 length:1026 start_codon:yes stop_codon:yes gene_type:complete
MDKTWKQLEQRCKLFAEGPDGLFIELLKEAECELANRCSLFATNDYFSGTNMFVSSDSRINPVGGILLPSTFKSIIAVFVDGDPIPRRNLFGEDNFKNSSALDFDANKKNNPEGYGIQVSVGDPTAYDIYSNRIIFDKGSASSDINIIYKANLVNSDKIGKRLRCIVNGNVNNDKEVWLETNLSTELNGLDLRYTAFDRGVFTYTNLQYDSTPVADIDVKSAPYTFDPAGIESPLETNSTYSYGVASSSTQMNAFTGTITTDPVIGETHNIEAELLEYRSIGPVINNDYHISLCDYAISIALAKTSQSISDKHKMLWEKTIRETLDDNSDRELNFSIREEI